MTNRKWWQPRWLPAHVVRSREESLAFDEFYRTHPWRHRALMLSDFLRGWAMTLNPFSKWKRWDRQAEDDLDEWQEADVFMLQYDDLNTATTSNAADFTTVVSYRGFRR